MSTPLNSADGGAQGYTYLSLATDNLVSAAVGLSASPLKLATVHVDNAGAGAAFLKLYDEATAPVPASDVPVATYKIAATGSRDIVFPLGLQFAKGIAFAITGAVGPTDTTATAANQVCLNLSYFGR